MVDYKGIPDYKHGASPCTGILLTNLGTPEAPTKAAVRHYLKEFLSDPRVVEMPGLLWWFVLNGIILNTRPRKSARAYEKVWTENGSPLLNYSLKQLAAIQKELDLVCNGRVKVELGMRYGNPSIQTGLEKLKQAGAVRILVFPLYPQYSGTTTASTFDKLSDILKTWRCLPEVRFINHYHDHAAYIDALVETVRRHWAEYGQAEKLLFSFHGIPKQYFEAGDPYYCECHKTVRLVIEQLQLQENEWQLTFQSRVGPREWLKPYTDETLKKWGSEGIKNVQVIAPGFSSDCLETIEEINIQNRQFFLQAGGEDFSYIPALNDQVDHIQALTTIILDNTKGWPEFSVDFDQDAFNEDCKKSKELAARAGADK